MFRIFARRACSFVLLCLISSLTASAEPRKPIRLRHGVIHPEHSPTAPGTRAAVATAPDQPARGLFLVQFTEPPRPEWCEHLRAMGVELLHYVPEDAFVAQFEAAPPGRVRQLSFVQWVGPYRPEHKLERKLQPARTNAAPLEVAVLLSSAASEAEVQQVKALFLRTGQDARLRSGRILKGGIQPAQLDALAHSDAVLWIEPAPRMKLFDEVSSQIVAGEAGPGELVTRALGYDGSGVTVAVADSGLNNGEAATMHPDLLGRTPAFFHYGSLEDAADEHGHGTHVAGIIAGNAATGEKDDYGALYGLGVAPGAQIVAQRLFDGAGNYEEPSGGFAMLTHDAVQAGAEIGSNSWGDDTQGRYDLSAMQFDELVRDADTNAPGDQPYILEFSAGNAGPGEQTIGSPAVAKNVIATGASQNNRFDLFIYDEGEDAMADFSSRGPAEDGRIKPDLTAPGTWIASLQSQSATDENAWLAISPNYQYQGGTSQAGPHVSAAAAVFVQYYRENVTNTTPSPALVKAALINSAVDMDDAYGTDPAPNPDEGWGRVDLTEIVDAPRSYEYVDQTELLTTGQVYERRIVVADPDEVLKVTLAYTDEPAFPGAIPALVNDLDLEVVAPDGRIYRGNQFADGASAPDAPSADRINNVEGVHLLEPLPGEYLVRVRAHAVVQDARRDSPAPDQDFALVISGSLLQPGAGLIFLNRSAYRVPAHVVVQVIDPDLAGAPSLNARLSSTTEPAGENIVLLPTGSAGGFTGAVATATGGAVTDGQLQIGHNDIIDASYVDVSAGVTRTATARADLIAPLLFDVATTNQFGQTVVRWTSDEEATSLVRYGTNPTPADLVFAVTNTSLTTSHRLALGNLVADQTYYYLVSSTDEAGNSTTNDQAGAYFSFVAAPAATVLLVDAYAPLASDPSPVIPRSVYTEALDQTDISYEVWDVTQRGSPGTNDLAPFRAVVWRVNDSLWGGLVGYPGLSVAEQTTLQRYVQSGGSLFLTSMELLTRMGNTASAQSFKQNVLHATMLTEDAGVDGAEGSGGDSVSSGMDLPLDYAYYHDEFWDLISQPVNVSDTIVVSTNASILFLDQSSGNPVGVRYPRTGQDSTGRVVFLAFPFDAVSATDPAPNNRANLMRNVLSFLVPGVNGIGTIALDQAAYPVEGLVTVEVADSDLAGSGTSAVTFYSDSDPGGTVITLYETVRPGLFRGNLTLIPLAGAAGPARLRAQHGDVLRAEYFDASNGGIVQATALVDTEPPVILNVAAIPDYEFATVTWETSEPTDALVQFWEGTPPFPVNRTAYRSTLADYHELTLAGLIPFRDYFYKVTVRDAAGNTVVDDNLGQFYQVRTLKPISPPWTDNFETGAPGWSVNDGGLTELGLPSESLWTLGPPDNGVETQAHSPTHVWSSHPGGGPVFFLVDTLLVSPAIDLTLAQDAELRFWQSYQFSEDDAVLEGGQVQILVSREGSQIPLMDYMGDSLGWEEAAINLKPYVGKVVYLIWEYYCLNTSFDPLTFPGWLIDDVSVTVSNAQFGTIRVTNNLWQASFSLNGQFPFSGAGIHTVISNAPAGQYDITFHPVPYFQTPSPQTNSLADGGSIQFSGNYTFADVNANGIPDAYELAQFQALDPARTQFTDTDGDGMSDWAEFRAGTDPNNPPPAFRLAARIVGGLVGLSWRSVSNHAYRVHAATHPGAWSPYSGWLPATGTNTAFMVPSPTNGAPNLFRVEAAPPAGPNASPPHLKVAATLPAPGQVRLDWPTVAGHGYRVLGSADGTNWTPATEWLRAVGGNMNTNLPAAGVARRLFRVEAHP